jgi:hypothetical protein
MMLRESSSTISEGSETYGERGKKAATRPGSLPALKPVKYDERRAKLISSVVSRPEAVQLAVDALVKLAKGKQFAALVKEYHHADPHSLHKLVHVILGYRPSLKTRVAATLKRCIEKSGAIVKSREPKKSPYRKIMDNLSYVENCERAAKLIGKKIAESFNPVELENWITQGWELSFRDKIYAALDSRYPVADKWERRIREIGPEKYGEQYERDLDDAESFIKMIREEAQTVIGFEIGRRLR